jgi:hypothetical protein
MAKISSAKNKICTHPFSVMTALPGFASVQTYFREFVIAAISKLPMRTAKIFPARAARRSNSP